MEHALKSCACVKPGGGTAEGGKIRAAGELRPVNSLLFGHRRVYFNRVGQQPDAGISLGTGTLGTLLLKTH